MNEENPTAERALKHIKYISGHIGPRPSGSQQEKAAQDYVAEELTKAGYQTAFQEFTFPAIPKFFPYLTLPAVFILLVILLPGGWKASLILLPFFIAGLPEIHTWLVDRFPKKASSQNLIAIPQDTTLEEVDVLFCAHIDSGRVIPQKSNIFQVILNNYMVILEVYSWLVAIIGLLYLSIHSVAKLIQPVTIPVIVLSGFTLIWLDIWQQIGSQWAVSPGANDNASGAALCSALAEEWMAVDDQQKVKVGFLFSGAEEAGLYGAKAFVRSNKTTVKQSIIINLDMIGKGSRIGAVIRSGRLKPLYTDSRLLNIVKNLIPDLVLVDYKYRGGDFIPFVQAGYRAISLEATHNGGLPPTYHSETDTPETIELEMINRMSDLLKTIIAHLN